MKLAVACLVILSLLTNVATAGGAATIVQLSNPRDVAFDLQTTAYVSVGAQVRRYDPATGASRGVAASASPGSQFMGAASRIDGCAIAFAETSSTQSKVSVYRLDYGYTIEWTVDPQQREPNHEAARRFLAVMNPPERRLIEQSRESESGVQVAPTASAPGMR